MTVHCPAKVNTFLSVGPPDQTGYHPICTIFEAVHLFDVLRVERSDQDSFHCGDASVPTENTVTKAWRLAREYVELPSLKVELEKFIPSQSGLGGGSSDAAGFLRALVKMTRGRFGTGEAIEVAAAVGSDVPFFLVGGRALGEGYGERLTPLPDREKRSLVVLMPQATVSTAEAYQRLDLSPRLLRPPQSLDESFNDFELVAPQASLEALDHLRSLGCEPCGLSGSGAAVFGFVPSERTAHEIASNPATRQFGSVIASQTLTREESLWTS